MSNISALKKNNNERAFRDDHITLEGGDTLAERGVKAGVKVFELQVFETNHPK